MRGAGRKRVSVAISLAIVAVAMIILAPSTDSRFIYTDF